MSQTVIDDQGTTHIFPDDATPSDFDEALSQQSMKNDALSSVYDPKTAPLARATAFGANYISQIPGLKELGSAEAAGLGAGQGDTFGDRYNYLENSQNNMREAGAQSNPDATTAAKLSGTLEGLGVGSGLLKAALPSATASFGSWAKQSPYLANMAASAPAGAIYGAANGSDTNSRIADAAGGAALSLLASPVFGIAANKIAAPALNWAGGKASDLIDAAANKSDLINSFVDSTKQLGSSVGSGIDSLFGNSLQATPLSNRAQQIMGGGRVSLPTFDEQPSSDELRQAGGSMMKQGQSIGGYYSPDFTDGLIQKAGEGTRTSPFLSNMNETDDYTDFVNRMQANKGKPMSLSDIQQLDQTLADKVDANRLPNGKLNSTGQQFYALQDHLRDAAINAPSEQMIGANGQEYITKGRQVWADSLKLRDIDRMVSFANDTTQPATALQTQMRTLVNNSKRMNFYNSEQQDAIRYAAKTGIATDVLRTVGSRLVPIAAGTVGEAVGGHAGAAASAGLGYALSSAARNAATALQMKRVNDLRQLITSKYMNPAATSPVTMLPTYGTAPLGGSAPFSLAPQGNQ